MTRITASPETLMNQAGMTVEVYLNQALRLTARNFGDEFAENNPEFVSQLVMAMASDYGHSIVAAAISDLAEVIENKRLQD
ncbi:hypothetical protein [Novosphingobium mangrovi (ex Hu et al. 2023)]|uniref:Uncharacterized protein n=1 Tax=Novosphingobium mangrovi (ex Hu et al. 2023) TaxID=2930094 RepID=A0ABT0A9M9_9SPHN|nr:hypothetical protein [Novosphingobium mangrovi (ex Hu et al. 2023)]MCJ1959901.1 hypothetical protein [Novosphingobium mangrovi (ex Hu et al. 2023)]